MPAHPDVIADMQIVDRGDRITLRNALEVAAVYTDYVDDLARCCFIKRDRHSDLYLMCHAASKCVIGPDIAASIMESRFSGMLVMSGPAY